MTGQEKPQTLRAQLRRGQVTAYQLAVELWQETGLPSFPVDLYSDGEKLQKKPKVKWGGVTLDSHPGDFNWRGANAVGVPSGERSGLIVLDLDSYKEGTGDLALWLQKHDIDLSDPGTRMHRTASGGTHLIYRMPEGHDLGNHAPTVHGLDVRGNGGFFVWADTQGRYSVVHDRSPAELPQSVLSELVAANEGRGRIVRRLAARGLPETAPPPGWA